MKKLLSIIAISLLIFACSGGGSHSKGTESGGETITIDYEDIEIHPIYAKDITA